MLIVNKETRAKHESSLPQILVLNANSEPLEWIEYNDCATLYAKDKILWSLGKHEVVLRGGMNAATGKQSTLIMDTIVAVDNYVSPTKYKSKRPALNNKALFKRDKHTCAYCGDIGKRHQLTRDHIIPTSRGGNDIWENVVTACFGCNSAKDNKLLAETSLQLLYVPYLPTPIEALILQGRNVLADQMEFLMKKVPKTSRLWS